MANGPASNFMGKVRYSCLTTDDPYHIPRYCGYCPQLKYQIGNTYGQTTHRLLTDHTVSTSGKTVLANIDMTPRVMVDNYNGPGTENNLVTINQRIKSYGDRKYTSDMVPGYTGYIPRGQHTLGQRYGQHCVYALSDFINETDKHEKQQKQLVKDSMPSRAPQRGEYTSDQMKLYVSKDRPPFQKAPVYMQNNDNNKYFVSGYTGFCPRAREINGIGYPIMTHQALNTFTDALKERKGREGMPAQIHRSKEHIEPSPVVYPVNSGMIPHYTGYIPGEKYRFGHTYGESTRATLQKTGLRPLTV